MVLSWLLVVAQIVAVRQNVLKSGYINLVKVCLKASQGSGMNTSNQQYALRPIAAVVGLLFATWVAQPVMAAQPATAPGAGTATQSGATTQAGTATQAGTTSQEAAMSIRTRD